MAFLIGQFNAHGVFTGNSFYDAYRLQRHRARQIFGQGDNLTAFDTLCRFDFVAGNHGAGSGGNNLYADAEFSQLGFNQFCGLLQFIRIDGNRFFRRHTQQVHVGFVVFAVVFRFCIVKQGSLDFRGRRNGYGNSFTVAAAACQRSNRSGGNGFGLFNHAARILGFQSFGADIFFSILELRQFFHQAAKQAAHMAAGFGHDFQP